MGGVEGEVGEIEGVGWREKGWGGGKRGGVKGKGVGWREKRVARCLSSSCLCPLGRVTLRTSNWVHPGNPVFELWILHVLTVPLGGALTPQHNRCHHNAVPVCHTPRRDTPHPS